MRSHCLPRPPCTAALLLRISDIGGQYALPCRQCLQWNFVDWPWSGSRTCWTRFAHEPDPMFRFGSMFLAGPNLNWGPGSTPFANLNQGSMPIAHTHHPGASTSISGLKFLKTYPLTSP